MEKEKYSISNEILNQLKGHPRAEEILKILLEDPDEDFEFEKPKNEVLMEGIDKLLNQLRFEESNQDNYFKCRIYLDEEYVGFLGYKIEGSNVKIIDFWTANKRNISDDISSLLREELFKMSTIKMKYLGFAILYYLFNKFKELGIYSFEIVSWKWSIEFYKKFFSFMEEIWKLELLWDWWDNVFDGILVY